MESCAPKVSILLISSNAIIKEGKENHLFIPLVLLYFYDKDE